MACLGLLFCTSVPLFSSPLLSSLLLSSPLFSSPLLSSKGLTSMLNLSNLADAQQYFHIWYFYNKWIVSICWAILHLEPTSTCPCIHQILSRTKEIVLLRFWLLIATCLKPPSMMECKMLLQKLAEQIITIFLVWKSCYVWVFPIAKLHDCVTH